MLSFKSINIISSLIFIGVLVAYCFFNGPFWGILLVAFVWFIFTGLGSVSIGWNYHFKSLNFNSKVSENQVAITFDDGPDPEFTPKVLEVLEKYNAKATFFCIGNQIESYPEIFKNTIKKGHTVGNHTYSHANNFGFFSTKKVISELQQTNAIVKKITGLELKYYRPAFGVTNPRIKGALKATGLLSVGWNKRSFDTTNLDEKTIFKRITKDLKKGDVILLHDTSDKTIIVLERLLLFLQQQNMTSVTIDSLFNLKAYA